MSLLDDIKETIRDKLAADYESAASGEMLDAIEEVLKEYRKTGKLKPEVERLIIQPVIPNYPVLPTIPANPYDPDPNMFSDKCPKCGISFRGSMGYVCQNADCPMGCGPTLC